MKQIILSILCALILTTKVNATECNFKEVKLSKKVYIEPIYKANTQFIFNKEENKALAYIRWTLDKNATRACFEQGESRFPSSKLIIPTVRMSDLSINVLGETNPVPLNVLQESNGHWSGDAELIKIPYYLKEDIINAVNSGKRIIKISGDLRFRMTDTKREVIGNINCTKGVKEAGVLNLYKRLEQIYKILDQRKPSEAINKEEVMQTFLGSCVQFQEVDSTNLEAFDSTQRLNSKLLKGSIPFKGNISREISIKMRTIGSEEVNILDI